MRVVLGMVLALAASPALAEWRALSGPEIAAALTDNRLVYDNAWQDFRASGRTLYNAGSDSWGYWRVDGARYCSHWPPANGWACYAMARDSETSALRFEGESGDLTVGRPAK